MRQLVLGLDAAGVMVRARPMDCVGAKVQLAPRLQSLVDQDPAECTGKAVHVLYVVGLSVFLPQPYHHYLCVCVYICV